MDIKEAQKFFDEYIWNGSNGGFIYHDIKAAIDANLNFLVAMALVTYTEFIGGLLPPLDSEASYGVGGNRLKFIRCLYRMHPWYKRTDQLLKQQEDKDVYEIFRNGLAHHYLIKSKLKVGRVPSLISKTASFSNGDSAYGIGVTSDGRLLFSITEYFRDFQEVITQMRNKIFEEHDPNWIEAFEPALRGS